MVKWALITGASSGIGLEFAKIHAAQGGNLVLVARRILLLEELKKELEKRFSIIVHLIQLDLSKPNAASELYSLVKKEGISIDFLINNAGIGGHGIFHELPLEKSLEIINLNIITLVSLTHLFLNEMIERNFGKILNIASMAGFIPGPLHSVYYSSKSFVISFSEALSNELKKENVTVSVLCPGPTETEFFKVANMIGARTLKRGASSAHNVAKIGYKEMIHGKRLIVPGIMNKIFLFGIRFLPRSIILTISRFFMEKK